MGAIPWLLNSSELCDYDAHFALREGCADHDCTATSPRCEHAEDFGKTDGACGTAATAIVDIFVRRRHIHGRCILARFSSLQRVILQNKLAQNVFTAVAVGAVGAQQ